MTKINTEPSAAVLDPDNYSYKEREWRRPSINEGEVVMLDEPGRVLHAERPHHGGTCCRSHYFLVTKPKFGQYMLKVKHGGGEESWQLDYDHMTFEALASLESDARFRLLCVIMRAHQLSAQSGYADAAQKYSVAFLEGRLKKRKKNGRITVEFKPRVFETQK